MPSTVTQVLAKFARRYPDVDAATQLVLFLDAHKRLLSRVQVRNDVQYVSLTAGTQEYDLSGQVFKIHSAYLQQDSQTQVPLIERSTDELDAMRWGWRNPAYTGNPIEYYITAADSGDTGQTTIGFVPIPSTTTSNGYPQVALYCTTYQDLTTTDAVPAGLLNDNYYLYEMYAKWAAFAEPEQADFWQAKAEAELDLNQEHVQNLQAKGTSGFFPTAAYMPTRVI
jgi:hypothetical protein